MVFSAPSMLSHGGIAMVNAYIAINSCFFASCHFVGLGDAQLLFSVLGVLGVCSLGRGLEIWDIKCGVQNISSSGRNWVFGVPFQLDSLVPWVGFIARVSKHFLPISMCFFHLPDVYVSLR